MWNLDSREKQPSVLLLGANKEEHPRSLSNVWAVNLTWHTPSPQPTYLPSCMWKDIHKYEYKHIYSSHILTPAHIFTILHSTQQLLYENYTKIFPKTEGQLFDIESSTNHLLFTCVCKCRVGIEDCGIPDISNHLAARPTYYLFPSMLSFYPFCILYFVVRSLYFVFWILVFGICLFLYFLLFPTIWLPGPPSISLPLCYPFIVFLYYLNHSVIFKGYQQESPYHNVTVHKIC